MDTKKNLAREIWLRCLSLVISGRPDVMMPNPLHAFDQAVRAGKYDCLDPGSLARAREDRELLGVCIWGREAELAAGRVLFLAMTAAEISSEELVAVADTLAEGLDRACCPSPLPGVCRDFDEYIRQGEEADDDPCDFTLVDQVEPFVPHLSRSKNAPPKKPPPPCSLTPRDIESALHGEGGIVGQDAAVHTAAMAFYNHLHGRPSVSLFCGPTGSGKTQIWRSLQKMAKDHGVPILIHDASSLTAEGWKGGNKLSTIFSSMDMDDKDEDPERTILVLDEFDKLLEPQFGTGGTNHSDLIQNQLLKLFDHDALFLGDEFGYGGTFVDTSHISVVLLGSFQRLLEGKTRKNKTTSIGFCSQPTQTLDYSNTTITEDDLIAHGLRAELAGRITRITCMEPLDIQAMTRIGQQEVEALSRQLDRPIHIDPTTLDALARIALGNGLGARAMKSRLSNLLDDMIYQNPDAESYCLEYKPFDADQRRQAARPVQSPVGNDSLPRSDAPSQA